MTTTIRLPPQDPPGRRRHTPLEREIQQVEAQAERLSGVADWVLPNPLRGRRITAGLALIRKLIVDDLPDRGARRALATLSEVQEEWDAARSAEDRLAYIGAIDAAISKLATLASEVAQATARPSVLAATREDVEAALQYGIRREKRDPGPFSVRELAMLGPDDRRPRPCSLPA